MGARADGLRQTEALPETEELLGLAGRIADREPVDWPSELARAGASGSRPWLLALEAIDRLGAISASVEEELPAPFSPRPERYWGHLEVVGLLGRGSYGSVHVARDPQLDRLVALKLFGGSGRSSSRDEARREGRLLARLKHPNIATVYGFDEREGELGLWMELVRGQTLAARVAEQGPMGALEAALAGVEVCRALAAAHAAGILHRDVKAQNVVREEGGRLVLVDFGLGLEDAAAQTARPSGTPLYLAPEVVGGHAPSVRSDLYAVGVLLYHLASGAFPVEAQDLGDLVDRHARGERRPLRDRRPDLPQAFVDAVERATAERPEERFASAGEMERALLGVVAGAGPRVLARSLPRRRLRIAAFLGLFGILAVVVLRERMQPPAPGSPAELLPRRMTSAPGWEGEAAISPDGTLVAYAASESGNSDLWIVDARGGEALRLTDDPAEDRWPTWLPDGSALFFESDRTGRRAVWRTSRLGGQPTFVADGSEPSVSPDGRRLAVTVRDSEGEARIAVVSLEAPASMRPITGAATGHGGHRSPAWSPDSSSIAFADLGNLWVVPAAGGTARALTSDGAGVQSPTWSPNGRWIYYGSPREGTEALWRIPSSGGRSERVTLGGASERHPRLSRDGSRLTYSTFEDRVELTVAELDSGRSLVQILSTGLELFPVFAPGAPALAYVTTRRGAVELHVAPLDGGRLAGPARPVVAATGVAPSHPTFSPDGRFLAYQRRAGRERDIYVVAVAGGPERPLVASSAAELAPAWSPTGRELAFIRQSGDRYELCRLPLVDSVPAGEPTRIVELPASPLTLAWSPDGTRLAVTALEGAGGSALWIVSSRGDAPPELRVEGRTVRRAVWLDNHRVAVSARWTGRGFSLRFVDVRTGAAEEPEVGFEFGSTSLAGYDLDLSPDRELIAFARGDVVGDVWVLEGPPGTF